MNRRRAASTEQDIHCGCWRMIMQKITCLIAKLIVRMRGACSPRLPSRMTRRRCRAWRRVEVRPRVHRWFRQARPLSTRGDRMARLFMPTLTLTVVITVSWTIAGLATMTTMNPIATFSSLAVSQNVVRLRSMPARPSQRCRLV